MQVVDLTDKYMEFVALCTHNDEINQENEASALVREHWIRNTMKKGLKIKVAVDDKGNPLGFAHCLPIELGAWGMTGKDLMTIPCLTLQYQKVYKEERGSGVGKALIQAVEEEAKKTKKGVATLTYDDGFWFMPTSFFKKLGYKEVDRQRDTVIMMKIFEPVAAPRMFKLKYEFKPITGKVVVDIFWDQLCPTSICEVNRVRQVCAEFGEKVVLNEYNCSIKKNLEKYQTARALFFNGHYKCWGYAAPKDEVRKEINKKLEKV